MFLHLSRLATGFSRRSPTPRPPLPEPYQDNAGEVGGPRQALLDGFLLPAHGRLEQIGERHARALAEDPLFYGPLSRWYQQHGSMRDHHGLFAAHLMAARDPEFRAHASVLLQPLRTYQVARVVRYTREVLHYQTRALRSAVRFWLQRREADPGWFDECVMRDRKSMKGLYASLHLSPGPRARSILFEDRFPAGSRLAAARSLARVQHDPAAQARLIRTHRIHFTTALGAVRNLTPEVLAALVEVMTPQQLVNHLAFLQRRGALAHPDFRRVVRSKLERGATESRVQDMKTLVALSRLEADPELASSLLEMTQDRLRQKGTITKPTAIFVDKSGSMDECILIGKLMATLVSTVADGPLFVEAFDDASFQVQAAGRRLVDWEHAFRHIRASGCTSIGAPLARLRHHRIEQIVLISDGEENTSPLLADELQEYQARHGVRVKVLFLKVGSQPVTSVEKDLQGIRADLTVLPFRGDYYNLPDLVPRLCAGSQRGLLEEVLSCRLYTKDDLDRLPPGYDAETCEIL